MLIKKFQVSSCAVVTSFTIYLAMGQLHAEELTPDANIPPVQFIEENSEVIEESVTDADAVPEQVIEEIQENTPKKGD